MAEFPPDLEDGELWLPSDIIRDVGARRPSPAAVRPPACSAHLAYLEGLARQLAALGLLNRAGLLPAVAPPHHASPHPLVFGFKPGKPASRIGPVGTVVGAGVACDGFRASGVGGGWVLPGSSASMLRFCSVLRPVQTQVAIAPGRVSGVVQAPVRPPQGRFVPFPGAGSAREYGGTGVFFPRVFKDEVKKKPNVTGGREQQKQQATRNGGVWEQTMPFQPRAGTSLPQDWRY